MTPKPCKHKKRLQLLIHHWAILYFLTLCSCYDICCEAWMVLPLAVRSQKLELSSTCRASLMEPQNSQFGRKDYWNSLYKKETNFSWYAGWDELQPFVEEFVDPAGKVLIPGVGNDAMLVDMFESGYRSLTAMDYALEGISRCRDMLGPFRLQDTNQKYGVELVVADARDLAGVFDNDSFDAVIEKGTLDAIYLSGGRDKVLANRNLNLAISELGRCVKPGGFWISIAAVADDQIQASFDSLTQWNCFVRKDDLFTTENGYTSNNVDGCLLVWQKSDHI